MTIRIGVKNLDTRENAIVAVRVRADSGEPASASTPDVNLKGGETTEQLVHSDQHLVIEEVQNG